MNAQIRNICYTLCFFLLTLSGYSQAGLYVSSGTSLFVLPGTTFSMDSLVLTPSAPFTMNGVNNEKRTLTTVHPLSTAHINRAFQFASTPSAYSGGITIYYKDAELNSVPEAKLTLNIYNGSYWTPYTTNAIHNSTQNYVTTPGLSNIALNELTLADAINTITSTVNTNSFKQPVYERQALNVKVLPNPATQYFTLIINSRFANPMTVRLMDVQGRTLELKSNIYPNTSLRVGDQYQAGIYFAEVIQGTQKVTVKLIKQPD